LSLRLPIAIETKEKVAVDMVRFQARAVSATELPDLEVFVVVLAEEPSGGGARLELQRALSFDEQDEELGLNTYCLSTEQGATHYGGVVSWTLTSNSLEVVLNGSAGECLGAGKGFFVELEADPEALAALKQGLERVLQSGS
jgi:immunity protein 10 of polymorphic toxin system